MRPVSCIIAISVLLVLSIGPVSGAPPENVSSADPRSPADERKAFHLPEGFDIELVAAEPEIRKPLNLAFDDQGRLWVTDTIEYPFPVPEGKVGRDGVKILSELGPDGRARKVTPFATGLNIPIGLLPYPSGRTAIVYSIPNILKLTDTDDDGKADRREPLYATFGAKDTHGMTNAFSWGFDGWIHACHGYSNESSVQGSDKQPIRMQSGNTYRMRPDGSHAEYFTHGQVNPFGLAYDALGNVYSTDCHTRPVYQLLRGAWYPSFGKPHDGLGFGPEMCTHDHGSTAIAGIVYYAADHFPEAYRDSTYVGNVVTNRINLDRIEWRGATPKAVEQPDFLVSDDPWFRPVDLELGPDGALYIADFYNRIIGHYEVPLTHPGRDRERGRIWRVVYRGKDGQAKPPSPSRPDLSTASKQELIEHLGHPNLAVRIQAANQLSERPGVDLGTIAERDSNPYRRAHALWVLSRRGLLSEDALAKHLDDRDRAVRIHALRIAAERPTLEGSLVMQTYKALSSADALVARTAAEALARHPDSSNIEPLLSLRARVPAEDTHLLHVVRMALRDQLTGDESWVAMMAKDPKSSEAKLVADVAPGVPTAAAARYLLRYLDEGRNALSREDLVRFVHHVARYGGEGSEARLLSYIASEPPVVGRNDEASRSRVATLEAMHQGLQARGARMSEDFRKYAFGLTERLLDSERRNEIDDGIRLASTMRLEGAVDRLTAIAAGDRPQAPAALAALSAINAPGTLPILSRSLADPAAPFPVREKAASLLAGTGQSEAQAKLLEVLPSAPERLQNVIAAGLAGRRAGAEALLDSIATGKASARLLQDARVAGALGNSGVPNLSERIVKLLRGLPPADARLGELISKRRGGFAATVVEPGSGAKVFETHCAACHQVGGKGATIGPQLDGVGARGVDRLLEDILDPSRNVDQTFRLTTLALADGRIVSGLLVKEEGAVLVLADSQGKEVRIPSESVAERSVAPLSPMPANFAEQVPEGDFYRLIAYLLSRGPAERK